MPGTVLISPFTENSKFFYSLLTAKVSLDLLILSRFLLENRNLEMFSEKIRKIFLLNEYSFSMILATINQVIYSGEKTRKCYKSEKPPF